MIHEHVANHSAADSCEHAEERGHDGVESGGQCLLSSGDGEQGEADGIEAEDQFALHVDSAAPEEDDERGQDRDPEVLQIDEGCGRDRADEYVACDSSGIAGDEGEDHKPEQVKPVFDAGDGSAEGEDKGAGQVEGYSECSEQVPSLSKSVIHAAIQA